MTCPGPDGGRPWRPVKTAWNGACAGQLRAATNGAGSACAEALPAPWTAPAGDTCRTCTSVPAAAWANSESRLWVRVAVNTKLPAIRPVLRATASAVIASRAPWLRRLANMARNMSVTPQGRVEGGHPVQDVLRGGPVEPA